MRAGGEPAVDGERKGLRSAPWLASPRCNAGPLPRQAEASASRAAAALSSFSLAPHMVFDIDTSDACFMEASAKQASTPAADWPGAAPFSGWLLVVICAGLAPGTDASRILHISKVRRVLHFCCSRHLSAAPHYPRAMKLHINWLVVKNARSLYMYRMLC